jgi:CheY-like chemotaxis protein/tetratricopeptide (TPR) repeat protein
VSKEVLIVDDDRNLAKALERAITAEGYAVRVAYDGTGALQKIREQRPGLVLLDLLLPNKDGRAVLENLRAREDTADLPVVVMTGVFRGRQHAAELEKAGAKGVLEKPFRRSDLIPLLRRHLGRPRPEVVIETRSIADMPGTHVPLSEQPVAKVLWDAMDAGVSGALVFESGKRRKIVVLRDGRPVQIGSNVARETLGNRLLASGRIDARALQESLARTRAGEGKQGEILVKLGAVSQSEVERALSRQSEEKLMELFSWEEGDVEFRPDVVTVARASALPSQSPRELVLNGIQVMNPKRVQQILAPHWEDSVAPGEEELSAREISIPSVAALLSALKAGPTVGAIFNEHGLALYALILVRALRVSAQKRAPAGGAPARGALAGTAELEERLEQQSGQNHFEVLGVAREVGPEGIREAFLRLAKRYHPDRYAAEGDAARDLAADVFARISRAHEVLSDAAARAEYESALRWGQDEPADGAQVNQIVSAEAQFQKGEAHFKKREYSQALEQFRWAIELNPNEGDFHAYYGWTSFLVSRGEEKAAATAQEHIDKARHLSPNSATVYYLTGLFRKTCEDLRGAEKMFRKALELSPSHVEAGREIRLLNMRKGSEKKRGLLGFGRKK